MGTPHRIRKHFPRSRALWTQSTLTQRVSFFLRLKGGVNQGSRHHPTSFPESDLVPMENQLSQPRDGVSDFALSRSSLRFFFFPFCAFLRGPRRLSAVSRDTESVPASAPRGPYPGGPRRAMEGAHDLLNDFQGEAKLNGMVRPLL